MISLCNIWGFNQIQSHWFSSNRTLEKVGVLFVLLYLSHILKGFSQRICNSKQAVSDWNLQRLVCSF
ncbi:hypothetical protein GIB67_039279, partial [Kingdonia uniflora]